MEVLTNLNNLKCTSGFSEHLVVKQQSTENKVNEKTQQLVCETLAGAYLAGEQSQRNTYTICNVDHK